MDSAILHTNGIRHFAACSVDKDVIHGALLINVGMSQYACIWTYNILEDFHWSPLNLPPGMKFTRIARHQNLIAVCTDKKEDKFVNILIWGVEDRPPDRCQKIRVKTEVIDFVKHLDDSFCVATETEIVSVYQREEKNAIQESSDRVKAVRYDPNLKQWHRFVGISLDRSIDPHGKDYVYLESSTGLLWCRDRWRSRYFKIPNTVALLGFFNNGKVILRGDDSVQCITIPEPEYDNSTTLTWTQEGSESDRLKKYGFMTSHSFLKEGKVVFDDESDESRIRRFLIPENRQIVSNEVEEEDSGSDEEGYEPSRYLHPDWVLDMYNRSSQISVYEVDGNLFLTTPNVLSIIKDGKECVLLK